MTERKLAQSIRVERDGENVRLFIDGVEFPYWLALEPIEVGPVHPDEVPSLRFTVLATRVDVVNSDPRWEESPGEGEQGQGKAA
ncbi:hypothetical protein [Streptomyces griseofuscus]|uniref:hypothetical protein n=1 Tax=Streptomyces griseofuscus TaxID=146922 RepID=UPI0036AE18DC